VKMGVRGSLKAEKQIGAQLTLIVRCIDE
jgi:hypothetical protein